MNFREHYYKDGRFMMPIWYDIATINEDGCIEMSIPHHFFPVLVENKVIRLRIKDQEFNNMDEAIQYHDSLMEKKGSKTKSGVVWVDSKGNKRSFEVVADNIKIGADTIILNMSTAHKCMSAMLGMCPLGGKCYAISKEKRFDAALAGDKRQEEQWSCMTPEAIAQGIKDLAAADPGIKYVRLNEAGEFRNLPKGKELLSKMDKQAQGQVAKAAWADVDDISKLKKIASLVPELKFYTYTHRKDLQEELKGLGKNIVINGSGFMVDNAFMPIELNEYLPIIDGILANRYKVVNGEKVSPNKATECIGDCRVCDKCKVAREMNIYLPIHGAGTEKQKALDKIKKKVIGNPAFNKILMADITDDEKVEQLLDIVGIEDKEMINKLKPLVRQRKGFFKKLLNSEKSKVDFISAIASYIESDDEPTAAEVAKEPSQLEKQKALAASVDALMGRLRSNLEAARSKGQTTGAKKWQNFIKTIDNIIDKARSGEDIKPTGAIAKELGKDIKRTFKGVS